MKKQNQMVVKVVMLTMTFCLLTDLFAQTGVSVKADEVSQNTLSEEILSQNAVQDEELLAEKEDSKTPNPCTSQDLTLSLVNGVLTIKGNGDYYTPDHNVCDQHLYYCNLRKFMRDYKDDIIKIKVEVKGITRTVSMFEDLPKVQSIDLSGLDTSQVTDMSSMFYNCGSESMKSLNLGNNFDTSHVTKMSGMFSGCGKEMMTELSLGNQFDTSMVTNMSNMFYKCGNKNLLKLDLGDKFDTSHVTNMCMMFDECGSNMSELKLGNKFDTSHVTNMSRMFYYCGGNITELNLGDSFDTSQVQDMNSMFNSFGMHEMTKLDLGEKFDTSKVTNMYCMFDKCGFNKMKNLNLGDKFDTSNVTSMYSMFFNCGRCSLTSLNLGDKFDTSKVTDMADIFYGCGGNNKLKNLYLGNSFKNICEKNTDMFVCSVDEKTKVYANPALKQLSIQFTYSSLAEKQFKFDLANIIPIIEVDLTGLIKDSSKVENGNPQTFDIDFSTVNKNDFIMYYSDKHELNGHNYWLPENNTKPTYTNRGKHTIYYYAMTPWSDVAVIGKSGSFTFELTCSHSQTEIRERIEATYTQDGYTGNEYCLLCGKKLKEGTVIPKLNKDDPTQDPTQNSTQDPTQNPTQNQTQDPTQDPDIYNGTNSSIRLNVTKIPLQKGQKTNKVKAKVTKDDELVSITSSNKKIVIVTNKGVIKGIKKGKAKIIYLTGKGSKAVLNVTVQNDKVHTRNIKVSNATGKKPALTLNKGKILNLKTTISPITSVDKLSYKSSDKKIVTVNNRGKLKAVKKGKAVITVKSGKKSMKITIHVK